MGLWLQFDLRALAIDALPLATHSPVELAVVVVRLPPEVEPDEQQTEGEEEDQGPEQLPLHRQNTQKNKTFIPFFNSKAAQKKHTKAKQSRSLRIRCNSTSEFWELFPSEVKLSDADLADRIPSHTLLINKE